MSINQILKSAWSQLQERQQAILQGRFGVGSYKEAQTLAALGERPIKALDARL